ncbi:MAG: hypothetical protein ACE5ID_03465, partial [Acidobacteriota bacterium]
AEYSSDLYSRRKLETSHRFTAGVFARWRDDLFATKSGRTLESMGPLVMGHRLDSSKSRDAFNIIIYTKGGLVLEMLSRRFKNPAAFPGMLRQIVKAAANRPISTEEFVAAIEKMSSIDLSSFAQQYIYGTGIPTLFYDYSFKKTAQGKWRVEGTIQQFPALRNEIRVERSEKGDLDVRRVEVPMGGTDGLGLVVPFQIQLKGKKAGVVNGRIGLRAGRTPFGLEIDQEPSRFRLDPAGEVLAVSLSQVDRPKAALLHLGLAQRRLGRKDEAEERLKEALAENDLGDERLAVNDFTIVMGALLGSSSRRRPDQDLIKPGRLLNEEEKERRRADLDRMARLELARLYLDQDRLSEAREMLEQTAEETGSEPGGKKKRKAVGWAGQDPGLVLLEARLALREQDYDGVLEKLQAAAEQLAVLKKSLEANTLLAAAAQGAGEDDAREKYSALARAAGADLTVLDE